jgi:transcription elongation factor GreA
MTRYREARLHERPHPVRGAAPEGVTPFAGSENALSTTIVPPVVPTGTDLPEPVVLTEQGQAWLRARMSDHIDELAAVATRLSEHVEAVAKAGGDADLPDPSHLADRDRYVELVQQLGALTSALREAVSVADVEEDPSIVELGDEVEVELPDGTLRSCCIVHPLEAPMAVERISVASPLARAVLGRRPGERATVSEPSGVYGVRVVSRRRLR